MKSTTSISVPRVPWHETKSECETCRFPKLCNAAECCVVQSRRVTEYSYKFSKGEARY